MNTEEEVNKADVFNMAQKYANLSHEDFDGNEDLHYQKGFVAGALWQQSQSADVAEKKGDKDDWISVEAQMPEDLEDVLGCHIEAGGVEKVYYSVGEAKWFPSDSSDNIERIVTHWQPLPTPPSKP